MNLKDTTFHDTTPPIQGELEVSITADSAKIDSFFVNHTDTLIHRDTVIRWLYNCGQFIKGDTVVVDTDSIQIVSFWNTEEQKVELRYFMKPLPVAIPAQIPEYTIKPTKDPISVKSVGRWTLIVGIPLAAISFIIALYKRIRGKKQPEQ